jgi:pimeloyl-ACP methyl ester carboxylesterase
MVRLRLLVSLVTLSHCCSAQASDFETRGMAPNRLVSAHRFERLDLSSATTGILIDRSRAESRIEAMSGEPNAVRATRRECLDAYFDFRAAADPRLKLPEVSALYGRYSSAEHPDRIPILLLDAEYDRVRPDLLESGALRDHGDGSLTLDPGVSGPVTEKRAVFAAASLRPIVTALPGLYLVLPSDLRIGGRVSSTDRVRVSIAGGPWQKAQFDQPIPLAEGATGVVDVDVEVENATGVTRIARTQVILAAATAPTPTQSFNVIAQYLHSGGTYATARVHVLLAPGHTELTRPLIVLDGFDVENGKGGNRGWDELYALLTQANLASRLQSLGFDLVVVDYTNALRYIQDNGYAVMEAIKEVRDLKVGNAPTVLVGPSMGGLVARYALLKMEDLGDPHNVTRFISFDAPQQFANIPQGDQWLLHFLAEQDDAAAEMLDILRSPAAAQMLVTTLDHPSAAEQDPLHYSAAPSTDARRTNLFDQLEALGNYPTLTELVAIANGSGSGTPQSAPNNQHMLIADGVIWDETWSWPLAEIYLQVFPVSGTSVDRIFFGDVDEYHSGYGLMRSEVWRSPGPRYDQAPGGMRNTQYEIAVELADAMQQGVVDAISPNHCFIPTVSALDFDTSNLFYDILADPLRLQKTPFDRIHVPTANMDHVEIDAQVSTWLINEAIGAPSPISTSLSFPDQEPSGGPLRTGEVLNIRWDVEYGAEPNFATTTLYLILDQTAGSTVGRTVWPIVTGRRTAANGLGSYNWVLPQNTTGDIRIPGTKTLHKIRIVTRDVHGNTVADESSSYFTVEWFGRSGDEDPPEPIPTENAIVAPGVAFSGVRPNPTSAPMRFGIKVDEAQPVTADLYDSQGRQVARFIESVEMSRGTHWFKWDGRVLDGSRAPAGIYFLRIGAGARQSTFKTVLLSTN